MPARLLAVATVPLGSGGDGISLRVARLLEHLARTWSIRLVAPGPTEQDAPWLRDVAVLRAAPVGRWSPAPSADAIAPVEKVVREALARDPADVLLLWVGAERIGFHRHNLPPTVGDRIDAVTLAALRDLRSTQGVRESASGLRTLAAYASYERQVVRSQAATIVVGEDDARTLRRLSGRANVHVVPNGVSAPAEPPEGTEDPRPTVIFSGVLSYPPNIDAVLWFAREVWPLVRTAEPTSRFIVAGRRPVEAIRRLDGSGGVEVHADVSDMREELSQAWLAVAPMRSGTGIKNKVLEAWATAKPAVLTTLASNGLALDADARDLVTDDARGMATRILALLRDSGERHRLGRAAHQLVRRDHSWETAASSVGQVLEQAAATGREPRV